MKRARKGEAGYVRFEKVRRFLITFIMFAIPIGLYNVGLAVNGTNKSILTVIAILTVLPAAKFGVDFIMIMLLKSAPEDIVKQTEQTAPDLIRGYELTVTAYEGRMPLDAVVVCGNDCACYSSRGDRKQLSFFEKHIAKLLNADGFYNINVKIFAEEKAFFDRIRDLEISPEKHRSGVRIKEGEDMDSAVRKHEEGILHTVKVISI